MKKIIQDEILVRYMSEEKKEQLFEIKKEIIIIDSLCDTVTVPIGFVTDFASVPKILWSFIGPIGKFNLASVIHDYFYTTHNCINRKFADNEFLKIMDYTNPSAFIRNRIMFYCVRLFGGYRWRHYGNGI